MRLLSPVLLRGLWKAAASLALMVAGCGRFDFESLGDGGRPSTLDALFRIDREAGVDGSPRFDGAGPPDGRIADATGSSDGASDAAVDSAAADGGDWWNPSFSRRRLVAIDPRIPASETLSDFPLLLDVRADAGLATGAKADASDLRFVTGAGLVLDHEVELYASSGRLVAWVRLPVLSAAAPASLYLYYGNASATSIANGNAVFSPTYDFVVHLSDLGSGARNSVAGRAVGDVHPGVTTAGGAIGNGVHCVGTEGLIEFDDPPLLNAWDRFTVSFLYQVELADDATWEANEQSVFDRQGSLVLGRSFRFDSFPAGEGRFQIDGLFQTFGASYLGFTVRRQRPQYITYVYDGNAFIAYSGQDVSNAEVIGADRLDPGTGKITVCSTGGHDVDVVVDEVRISRQAHSPDWIGAIYRNMSAPGAVTVGPEETR